MSDDLDRLEGGKRVHVGGHGRTGTFTQRRSAAKSVGCSQRRPFLFVLFVCKHNNVRTSKHRTMKLGR